MSAKSYFLAALGQLVLSAVARIEGASVTAWAILALAILSVIFGWHAFFLSVRTTDNKEQ
ncbi:hypothetical protein [Achromobacter xylosoxidans]|uniref:Putative membrane protein 23 n=1 Tax=Achromobacter xylosoxidans (strain A8) TaxID=762376 RepID=E3HGM2_ACHXA|nr:hypothetical protein [Achromobacter xylosoxidans]ADP15358.1 putative membrane protein 23 [Achromobacter xylosoxidans A8]